MFSVTGHAQGSGAAKSSTRSAPVITSITPGIVVASEVSMATILACATWLRTSAHVRGAGNDEVVHETGLTGEQRRILLAEGALAEDRAGLGDGGHRGTPAPPAAAAASTAFTMLW